MNNEYRQTFLWVIPSVIYSGFQLSGTNARTWDWEMVIGEWAIPKSIDLLPK